MAIDEPSYDLFKYSTVKDHQTVGFYLAKRERSQIYLALLGVSNNFQKGGLGLDFLRKS